MDKDVLMVKSRLMEKLLGDAIGARAEALVSSQRLREKIARQLDANKRQHVQIIAYKFMVEYLMEHQGRILMQSIEADRALSQQDALWKLSVQKAVEKLRSKGVPVEDKHIPKLKAEMIETIDHKELIDLEDVSVVEVSEPRDSTKAAG